jgi:hypothetical protein
MIIVGTHINGVFAKEDLVGKVWKYNDGMIVAGCEFGILLDAIFGEFSDRVTGEFLVFNLAIRAGLIAGWKAFDGDWDVASEELK